MISGVLDIVEAESEVRSRATVGFSFLLWKIFETKLFDLGLLLAWSMWDDMAVFFGNKSLLVGDEGLREQQADDWEF